MRRKAYRAEPEVQKVGFLCAILLFDHGLGKGCGAALGEAERFTGRTTIEQVAVSPLPYDETPERISEQFVVEPFSVTASVEDKDPPAHRLPQKPFSLRQSSHGSR